MSIAFFLFRKAYPTFSLIVVFKPPSNRVVTKPENPTSSKSPFAMVTAIRSAPPGSKLSIS